MSKHIVIEGRSFSIKALCDESEQFGPRLDSQTMRARLRRGSNTLAALTAPLGKPRGEDFHRLLGVAMAEGESVESIIEREGEARSRKRAIELARQADKAAHPEGFDL